jgi:hypothetical protein
VILPPLVFPALANVCRETDYFLSFVGWHASAVNLPLSDVILTQLACTPNDVIFIYIRNN